MSEDIVVQLRGWTEGTSDDSRRMVWLMRQSADTIEALQRERDHAAGNAARYLGLLNAAEAEAARLKAALEQLKMHIGPGYEYAVLFAIIDKALAGETT